MIIYVYDIYISIYIIHYITHIVQSHNRGSIHLTWQVLSHGSDARLGPRGPPQVMPRLGSQSVLLFFSDFLEDVETATAQTMHNGTTLRRRIAQEKQIGNLLMM